MAQQYGEGGSITVQMAGPFGGSGTAEKLTDITLPVSEWKGGESPYSQVVAVEGVSVNSKIYLDLSAEQTEFFRNKCIALTAQNNGGTVTVFAIGDKPTDDYVIQASIKEVTA